jgi:hypothetical protein
MKKSLLAMLLAASVAACASAGLAQESDGDDDDDEKPAAEETKPAEGSAATAKPTRSSQNVPELKLGTAEDQFAINQKEFELIAGQGYRWKISSAGGLEYKLKSDLFRDVWWNQIVISDLEIHMNGAPAWLEFDAAGTIQAQFTTVRPGTYKWWVDGLEDKGMTGTITVK